MLPKRDRPIIILPQNTSLARIIKVTGCHDVPTGINGLRNIKLAIRFDRNALPVGSASHLPDRHRTVVVPPQDIVFAGAIKIRDSYRFPRRSSRGGEIDLFGKHSVWSDRRSTGFHLPDRSVKLVIIEEQDPGCAASIEITGCNRFPCGTGILTNVELTVWEKLWTSCCCILELPNCQHTVVVLQKHIRDRVAVEVRGGLDMPRGVHLLQIMLLDRGRSLQLPNCY